MTCTFCNSDKNKKLAVYSEILKKEVFYYKCKKCNSINQYPIPTNEEIKNYYESYIEIKGNMNPGYLSKEQLTPFFNERDKTLSEIGFDLSIIKEKVNVELGCANGHFLQYLKNKEAKTIIGVDISENLVNLIKIPDIKFLIGDLSIFDSNSIDNLYLFNILEHIPHLENTFKQITRITKNDSNIIIEIPITGIISSFFAKKWRFLMPDEHLHLPSLKGLKNILKKYDLKIVGTTRFGSGFTSGMIHPFFKNRLDYLAKKLKFGDRGAFLIVKESFDK
ncbi:MAG: hypothetical protein A2Y34_08145 [Spirochaetes bacterium GWC1_27_15]|nr:MAG: hypothetical protein A2Z98_04130 [Spirochaetes bacterium GWB1_27_13]OHD20012.1 MAG: hypothetical protein A2Y34_08145 [Spirochaetes bacterium GWC1_27_15]